LVARSCLMPSETPTSSRSRRLRCCSFKVSTEFVGLRLGPKGSSGGKRAAAGRRPAIPSSGDSARGRHPAGIRERRAERNDLFGQPIGLFRLQSPPQQCRSPNRQGGANEEREP
jgi:hypothetical protein